MTLSLRYQLTGAKSAELALQSDDSEAHVFIWLITDALRDLIELTTDAIRDDLRHSVRLQDEQGEHRICAQRSGSLLKLRIVTMKDTYSRDTDDKGSVILEEAYRARTFAGAIVATTQDLLRAHGAAGYQKLTGYDFPLIAMNELRTALAEQKSGGK